MGDSPEDLRQTMRAKSDEELYIALRVRSQDYTLQSLALASEEFRRRKLDEAAVSRLIAVAEKGLEENSGKHGADVISVNDAKETAGGWGWSDSDLKETAKGWGCLVLLCFIGYAIYGGYKWLDSIGWISHREETVISARSDWLVGESKECWSATLNSDGAAHLNKEVGYAMSSVTCDDGPEHKMNVTFYGRKVQTEYKTVSWRCNRDEVSFLNDNSFTCYQTGGQP